MTTSHTLTEFQVYIQESGWAIRSGKPINYGDQFIVSDGNDETIVNYYPRRGKFSIGGPECDLKSSIQAWLGLSPQRAVPVAAVQETSHIGMDESGKGDWFGPLVVVAVSVDEGTAATLSSIGVKDSKKLSTEQIIALAAQIRIILPASAYQITLVEPPLYNTLYAKFQNINLLLAEQYAETANTIWQRTQAPRIVCDQFSQLEARLADAFLSYPELPVPIQLHHAEDSSIAVATASILATDAYRVALSELSQRVNLGSPLPRGSSETVRLLEAVEQIIARYGAAAVSDFAKIHFKPIAERLKGIRSKTNNLSVEAREILPGEKVIIRQKSWHMTEYDDYIRFTFYDGGILDWYNVSSGKFTVRGKPFSESYKILYEKAHGKSYHGETTKLHGRINELIPEYAEIHIPCVQGIGWSKVGTVFGYRFRFTDGAQVNYYVNTNKVVLQGTLRSPTKDALEALSALTHSNTDDFSGLLRSVFPDFSLGESAFAENEMVDMDWQALDNALDWRNFWDSNRALRRAANLRSPCQREFIDDWASVLANHQSKRHLLAHAPTGLGKTVSALVPALAWIARSPHERRVYYLVNRLTQHDNPIRELHNLAPLFEAQTGQPLKVVDMAGRSQACISPVSRPMADICRQSSENADFNLLPPGVSTWQEVSEHVGDEYCAYHLLRSLVPEAHIIICDYWWLFSIKAQQSGLAENLGFSFANAVVIVDEAHNLPLRMRNEIDIEISFELLREQVTQYLDIEADQNSLNRLFDDLLKTQRPKEVEAAKIVKYLGGQTQVADLLSKVEDNYGEIVDEPELVRVLRALNLEPSDLFVYLTEDDKLICKLLDPAGILQRTYDLATASLSMSGTLSAPRDNEDELRYLIPLYGLPKPLTLARKYFSPFPLANQRWIYNPDVRGTYEQRSEHLTYYAQQIVQAARVSPGITAAFFSSYDFLASVFEEIKRNYPGEEERIICEGAADIDSDDVLNAYDRSLRTIVNSHGYGILLAIYQGQLGEGANFHENLIKTIICVSIPMQFPSEFHARLQKRYEQHMEHLTKEARVRLADKAREYALDRYSLSLVLQVCGRGIRHETDQCAFVLLDQRYHEYQWRRFLMPMPYNLSKISNHLLDFHQPKVSTITMAWDTALLPKSNNTNENKD